MTLLLSRAEVREIDRRAIEEFCVPGVVLMENAGRGIAELLRNLGIHDRVIICCGKGNNGGDGFVIARHLSNALVPVKVLLFAEPDSLQGDAAINFRIVAKAGLPIDVLHGNRLHMEAVRNELSTAEWVVDALFGTGLSGPLRSPFDEVVAAINDSPARVLAVDIPSGLDCDTGQPFGSAVRAHHTGSLVTLKKGFTEAGARAWLGQIHVIDIGIPRVLLTEFRQRSTGC